MIPFLATSFVNYCNVRMWRFRGKKKEEIEMLIKGVFMLGCKSYSTIPPHLFFQCQQPVGLVYLPSAGKFVSFTPVN